MSPMTSPQHQKRSVLFVSLSISQTPQLLFRIPLSFTYCLFKLCLFFFFSFIKMYWGDKLCLFYATFFSVLLQRIQSLTFHNLLRFNTVPLHRKYRKTLQLYIPFNAPATTTILYAMVVICITSTCVYYKLHKIMIYIIFAVNSLMYLIKLRGNSRFYLHRYLLFLIFYITS